MSIRPIDMQVAVRGTQEAGVQRQNFLTRQENQILNAQQQMSAERQRETSSVNTDIRTEEVDIKQRMKSEEREQESGKERDNKKESKKEEPEEKKLPGEKGSILDIRI
ncbi:MAG: hypothetical protein Q4A41_01320 [Bacillota bacterium]|nr:hypothetical protein [Bacillota bacterium]